MSAGTATHGAHPGGWQPTTGAAGRLEHWYDPLRQRYDHQHEDRTDDQLPDKRQIAGQVGADHVDGDRAKHGADQRSTPAERNPHHQFGAEHEAPDLRRDDHRIPGICIASDRGDHCQATISRILTRGALIPR